MKAVEMHITHFIRNFHFKEIKGWRSSVTRLNYTSVNIFVFPCALLEQPFSTFLVRETRQVYPRIEPRTSVLVQFMQFNILGVSQVRYRHVDLKTFSIDKFI